MITPHDRRGYNHLSTHNFMGSIRILALFGEEVLFAAKLPGAEKCHDPFLQGLKPIGRSGVCDRSRPANHHNQATLPPRS